MVLEPIRALWSISDIVFMIMFISYAMLIPPIPQCPFQRRLRARVYEGEAESRQQSPSCLFQMIGNDVKLHETNLLRLHVW
jgi:hypothetical protein